MTMTTEAEAAGTSSDELDGRGLIGQVDPAKIRRTTSMLGFNDIRDMVQFGNDLDSLSGSERTVRLSQAATMAEDLKKATAVSREKGSSDNDSDNDNDDAPFFYNKLHIDEGFFIDGSDDDPPLSLSPDCVSDLCSLEKAKPSGGLGGMRRVMSVASLSTKVRKISLSSLIPTINEGAAESPTKQAVGITTLVTLNDVGEVGTGKLAAMTDVGAPPLRSCMKRPASRVSSHSSLPTGSKPDDLIKDGSYALQRNVSFSSLEIRSYNVTLGDAATSNGPAISLDWDYDPATLTQDVEEYEEHRASDAPRRSKHEMHMPPEHRRYLLLREAGCSRQEIAAAVKEAQRVARQRAKTARGVQLGYVMPMEAALEKTKRKIFGKPR